MVLSAFDVVVCESPDGLPGSRDRCLVGGLVPFSRHKFNSMIAFTIRMNRSSRRSAGASDLDVVSEWCPHLPNGSVLDWMRENITWVRDLGNILYMRSLAVTHW